MTDPIADMITRIKNALMAGKTQVLIPHSKINEAIGNILVSNEYVENLTINQTQPQPEIVLNLKYIGKVPAITDVKRISRPGRRTYSPSKKVPRALGGYGITIITTSRGVMTDKDARKQNVGGEVLCQIW